MTHPIDAHELLDAIDACYACDDLGRWPAVVLAELRRLIPCDTAAFNDIDPLHHRLVVELSPFREVPADWEEIWARFGHQNLAYSRLVQGGEVGPYRLSDLMSQRELLATELYKLMYAPIGIRFQLATALEAPAPQVTAIVLMRGARDFTLAEVELLRLIRPHLRRSYDAAREREGIPRTAREDEAAAVRAGVSVVTLDPSARIVEITPRAGRIVAHHLDEAAVGSPLPAPLASWAERALRTRDPRFERFGTRNGVIRTSVSPCPDGAILLVEEDFDREVDPLPLSSRQREVLEAVATGATNAEAAAALSVTPSTIANHLAAIYERLGVRNRVGALAVYERSTSRKRGN
ncbi:MAG TPA: LuxR C-terminal-related transcriptional regulator [Gaiellaceae bacterium]|jgi:DNA-binding CsgD family transcriptional regulator|nr:LuxR C-terminal-related transcriptional regulator [Gaiellaceae bacterium]